MSAVAPPRSPRPPAPPAHPAPPASPTAAPGAATMLLPPSLARALGLLALLALALPTWARLLEPPASAVAWRGLALAATLAAALIALARLNPRARAAGALAATLAAAALAAAAGGAPRELLVPAGWGEGLGVLGRGLDALPGLRVPYRGFDEDARFVLACAGPVLAVLAAALAFWPRERPRRGFPTAALAVALALAAVPSVSLGDGSALHGAAVALAALAFLRLERLSAPAAPAAAGLAVTAALAGLAVTPLLDRPHPWLGYEQWAADRASSRTVSFSWEHSYGPLDWPRDGREMMRVDARAASYWKAQNLDVFDGERWTTGGGANGLAPASQLPDDAARRPEWFSRIRVTVRALRSRQYVTAGTALAVLHPNRAPLPGTSPGTYEASRSLRRGDAYQADVYTPRPISDELRAAPAAYESGVLTYLRVGVRTELGLLGTVVMPPRGLRVKPYAVPSRATGVVDGAAVLRGSELARTWRLARRLSRGTPTAYDFVRRVQAYLRRGFTYTETPPPAAGSLPGFLFEARAGYCQQFSGAMALLLRLGGIPARVAAGFAPGALDRERREYVVRDLDAHSWVEVWFPGLGWITFDPTPSAAPARSQALLDLSSGPAGDRPEPDANGAAGGPDRGDEAVGDAGGGDSSGGVAAPWWALAAVALALALALGALARRRRSTADPVAELERALRRSGRPPSARTTLWSLERRYASDPAAAAYVRALRDGRYGGRERAPSAEQRRALRRELARGLGWSGRLRAWWALPPRLRRPSRPAAGPSSRHLRRVN